jgi:hypothetical protein
MSFTRAKRAHRKDRMQHDMALQPVAPAPFVTVIATPVAGGQHQLQVQTNMAGAPGQVWEQVLQMLFGGLRIAVLQAQEAGESRIVRPQLSKGRESGVGSGE